MRSPREYLDVPHGDEGGRGTLRSRPDHFIVSNRGFISRERIMGLAFKVLQRETVIA